MFLALAFTLLTKYLHRHEFECAIGFGRSDATRLRCRVSRDQNILALSGFRGAPIFTLLSTEKASDHREARYDIVHQSGGTLFRPEAQNPYDAIMVFGLNLN